VWVVGLCTDIEDVLNDCGVPEDDDFRSEVLSGVNCPGCGDSIDSWTEVGVRFAFEIEHDNAVERAGTRYDRKLCAFSEFLEKYPMLGAAHPMGRRILKEIGGFPRARLKRATWFRARRLGDGRELCPDDMRVPDPEKAIVSPGRFNHLGQAHWYLASSEYTAVSEVVDEGEDIAWLQKWIVNPVEPVLDLVQFGADDPFPVTDAKATDLPLLATAMIFGGHLNRPSDRRRGWKPEYFIPHFIADAAKSAGFRGIRFSSTRGLDVNLVIFDSDAPVEADGQPFLYNLKDLYCDTPLYNLKKGDPLPL
jgi:hypothetical protein